MKNVLLTGAGGFIGSHLAEALVRQGARLRAFVHYNSRGDPGLLRLLEKQVLAEVELVPGDLVDPQAVQQATHGCDTVFHLGALISIPYSYAHPRQVVETNVLGTLNVLLACREEAVDRLVHASSSEVYGTAQRTPMDEEHPLHGQSPYAASKIGADQLAESFYCAYRLPVVTVRPFNTYGPRQSTRAVIPTIVTQALTQETIRLGNLEARRDFTYVTDTVVGFLRAGQVSGAEGNVFNLGSGQEVKVGDLVELICNLVKELHLALGNGQKPRLEVDKQRLRPEKSEVERLRSDNRRARHELGWEPQVSLEDGLRETIAWIAGHLEMYRTGIYEF